MMTKKIKYIVSSVLIAFGASYFISGYFFNPYDHALDNNAPLTFDQKISSAKEINQRLHRAATSGNVQNINNINVKSLAGITSNASLLTDPEGNLKVTVSIKDLIEFYLSTTGEESLEQILKRIQSDLNEQLEQPALGQALSLLKRYIDYKIELAVIEDEAPHNPSDIHTDLENIKNQKIRVNALRAAHFEQEEHDAFFKQEELYDDYMLRHLEISNDESLDNEAKKHQLALLEQTLPDDMLRVRKKVTVHSDLYEQAKSMKEEGASDEEVFRLREQALGAEAAQAMATLDQKRVVWNQRLSDYAVQRDIILDSGLSQQDQTLAINGLISEKFSATEGVRVRALSSSL